MVERIRIIRLIMVVGAILVMFLNLFDIIQKNGPLFDYATYVLSLLILCLMLVFIPHDSIIAIVLAIMGFLIMLDLPTPNYLSGGIIFFIFSINIVKNHIFSFFIYFLTILVVVGTHIFNTQSPADAINVLIGYSIIYLLNYLLIDK